MELEQELECLETCGHDVVLVPDDSTLYAFSHTPGISSATLMQLFSTTSLYEYLRPVRLASIPTRTAAFAVVLAPRAVTYTSAVPLHSTPDPSFVGSARASSNSCGTKWRSTLVVQFVNRPDRTVVNNRRTTGANAGPDARVYVGGLIV